MSRSRQQAEKPQSLLEFELCVCKIDVLGAIKSTEFVLVIKTCFGQICACNIGDPARTRSKKLFIDEEPPGVAKDK